MDECDNLTNDAWLIIRNPIENEQTNPDYLTRFILQPIMLIRSQIL